MTPETQSSAGAGSLSGPANRAHQPPTPPRPIPEIISDLGRERDGLVEAVDNLKLEARSTRERVLSPRTFAILGGALASLFLLRRRRKRR